MGLQDVLHDLKLVEKEAGALGLQLNQSKTELICDDATICESMLLEAPGLHVVSCSRAILLGSPIECVDDIIQNKVEVLQLMGSRLGLLTSHDALLLLRHSFAIPKVLYILRTSPCFLNDRLESFDDESTWLQASLPRRMGGIGIRRAVQLAPSAYLASAAGCSELIRQVLPSHLLDATDPNIETALSVWS